MRSWPGPSPSLATVSRRRSSPSRLVSSPGSSDMPSEWRCSGRTWECRIPVQWVAVYSNSGLQPQRELRGPPHRHSSSVLEEVGKDTAQGARDSAAPNEGSDMTSSLKQFKRRALSRPGVKAAYDASAEEFAFLDEVLKARAEAGLTQAEVAERIGTTQSAVARLESAEPKHSPSIATLQKYAKALGYTVQLKLVKERRLTTRSSGPEKSVGRGGAQGK